MITSGDLDREGHDCFSHHRIFRASRWRFDAKVTCWVGEEPSAVGSISVPAKFKLAGPGQAYALQLLDNAMRLTMYEPDLDEAVAALDEACSEAKRWWDWSFVPTARLLECEAEARMSAPPVDLDADTALDEGQFIIVWLCQRLAKQCAETFDGTGLLAYLSEEQLARGLTSFLADCFSGDPKNDPEKELWDAETAALRKLEQWLSDEGYVEWQAA